MSDAGTDLVNAIEGIVKAVDRLKAAAKLKMAELVQCEADGGEYVHANHMPARPADPQ